MSSEAVATRVVCINELIIELDGDGVFTELPGCGANSLIHTAGVWGPCLYMQPSWCLMAQWTVPVGGCM